MASLVVGSYLTAHSSVLDICKTFDNPNLSALENLNNFSERRGQLKTDIVGKPKCAWNVLWKRISNVKHDRSLSTHEEAFAYIRTYTQAKERGHLIPRNTGVNTRRLHRKKEDKPADVVDEHIAAIQRAAMVGAVVAGNDVDNNADSVADGGDIDAEVAADDADFDQKYAAGGAGDCEVGIVADADNYDTGAGTSAAYDMNDIRFEDAFTPINSSATIVERVVAPKKSRLLLDATASSLPPPPALPVSSLQSSVSKTSDYIAVDDAGTDAADDAADDDDDEGDNESDEGDEATITSAVMRQNINELTTLKLGEKGSLPNALVNFLVPFILLRHAVFGNGRCSIAAVMRALEIITQTELEQVSKQYQRHEGKAFDTMQQKIDDVREALVGRAKYMLSTFPEFLNKVPGKLRMFYYSQINNPSSQSNNQPRTRHDQSLLIFISRLEKPNDYLDYTVFYFLSDHYDVSIFILHADQCNVDGSPRCQRIIKDSKLTLIILYNSILKHYEPLSMNDVFLFEIDNPLIIKLNTLDQQYSHLAGRDEEMFLYRQQEELTNGTTSTTSTSAKPVNKKSKNGKRNISAVNSTMVTRGQRQKKPKK